MEVMKLVTKKWSSYPQGEKLWLVERLEPCGPFSEKEGLVDSSQSLVVVVVAAHRFSSVGGGGRSDGRCRHGTA